MEYKYKVGDKVCMIGTIIHIDEGYDNIPYKVHFNTENDDGCTRWCTESSLKSLEDYSNESYEQGAKDTWRILQRLALHGYEGGYSALEIEDIFQVSNIQGILREYDLESVLEKIRIYEEEKQRNSIKVGDVVTDKHQETEILVTAIYEYKNQFDGIKVTFDDESGKLGATYSGMRMKDWWKTNKRVDLQSIFDGIGKE